MNAATEIIENIFKEKPLDLYDYILRGPFCDIYTEFKKTHKDDCRNYSSLLIDKFAIHSASFFHLSKGMRFHLDYALTHYRILQHSDKPELERLNKQQPKSLH